MTEKRPLFRPEAVEHHARARTSGRTLDLRERRTHWLFRGLLVGVLLAVAATFVIRVERTVQVPSAGSGSAQVTVPVVDRVLSDLRERSAATVRAGGREYAATVTGWDGADGTGFALVTVEAAEPVPRGDVVVVLRLAPRTVADLLTGRG